MQVEKDDLDRCQYLLPHPPFRVLELGCGRGEWSPTWVRKFGATYYGVDADARKIRDARKKFDVEDNWEFNFRHVDPRKMKSSEIQQFDVVFVDLERNGSMDNLLLDSVYVASFFLKPFGHLVIRGPGKIGNIQIQGYNLLGANGSTNVYRGA